MNMLLEDNMSQAIEEANDIMDRLELYRWLKKDELIELFDVLTDGYYYRKELEDAECD